MNNEHSFYKCPPECEKTSCAYCDGGLAWCTVCGEAEGTLAESCPGRPKAEPPERMKISEKLRRGLVKLVPCPDGIEGCSVAHYQAVEPKAPLSLEDAAHAYLVEHGWHKESNTFAYQAVVNRMADFARQQRKETIADFVRRVKTEMHKRTDEYGYMPNWSPIAIVQAIQKEMNDEN